MAYLATVVYFPMVKKRLVFFLSIHLVLWATKEVSVTRVMWNALMTMIKSDLFFFSSTEHIVRSNEKQAKQVQATKQSHNQYSSIHWHK